MKLQILIPRYRETGAEIAPLLDSIAGQQNVDFSELGVILADDGEDFPLDAEALCGWPFEIRYISQEHKGVSAARNLALDRAEADYVMFCDADDLFCHACGLWMLFRELEKDPDAVTSCFLEELRLPGGRIEYLHREHDRVFVHGKAYKRSFLLENGIRWDEELRIHEDSFFNFLALDLAKAAAYIETPFYLWRWRDGSVCRHDPKYLLRTWPDMIASNEALVSQMLLREKPEKAREYLARLVLETYYTMQKPEWRDAENEAFRAAAMARLGRYLRERRELWEGVSEKEKAGISAGLRDRIIHEGMEMERQTLSAFLEGVIL